MEIITAIHIIKPSSPTPLELKTYKLSSIDQVSPPIYTPIVFFYQNHQSTHHSEISRHLRQSLSEILTIYYPLAGTRQNSFIDCNDRGAVFVEARVHARLSQLLQAPSMEELKQLVPVDCSTNDDSHSATPLLIKLSYFDCGGICIGVCLSHMICDAASLMAFMNAWAAMCRHQICGGETPQSIRPCFDLSLHFPPIDPPPASEIRTGITKQKITTKRFVFEEEMLEKLRKIDPRPTRVEAVSAFIWRSFIQAYKAKHSPPPQSYAATHVVNLRPRTDPPLPDQITGNCLTIASAVASPEEADSDDMLVLKLRAAIRTVDDAYINRVVKHESYFRGIEEADDLIMPENILFTSWVRFPMYDVDFGWGKPVWVCPNSVPYMNAVLLMSTADGNGVEAWINMLNIDDAFFQTLQANYDKLFASLT